MTREREISGKRKRVVVSNEIDRDKEGEEEGRERDVKEIERQASALMDRQANNQTPSPK